MARMARIVVPEYPHHVTQQGVRSLPIFADDEDRRSYFEFMIRETQHFRLGILVWCFWMIMSIWHALKKRPGAIWRKGTQDGTRRIP